MFIQKSRSPIGGGFRWWWPASRCVGNTTSQKIYVDITICCWEGVETQFSWMDLVAWMIYNQPHQYASPTTPQDELRSLDSQTTVPWTTDQSESQASVGDVKPQLQHLLAGLFSWFLISFCGRNCRLHIRSQHRDWLGQPYLLRVWSPARVLMSFICKQHLFCKWWML